MIRIILVITVLFLSSYSWAKLTIPLVPTEKNGEGFFIHDYAGIIDKNARERIGSSQERAFEQHSIPIIVVTINSMKEYGFNSNNIAEFSKTWFNSWKIGTLESNGKNSGILLLFSFNDKKVRIQLGDDYGHNWDSTAEHIIDRDMLPFFRDGEFARGLSNGVESIVLMVENTNNTFSNKQLVTKPVVTKPVSANASKEIGYYYIFLPCIIGIGMMIASFFSKEKEKSQNLLKYGFYLFIFPLAVLALIMYLASKSKGSNRSNNSSHSGGFYGGGYSGGSTGSDDSDGGGASGKW